MPFPYTKIIARAIGCNDRPIRQNHRSRDRDATIARWGDGGHGNAVSLHKCRTRQCRFPTQMQDTALPFLYTNAGHGNAVSLQTVFLPMFKNANPAK